jgi:transcriptional regulator with XRE-family HTH domain
MNGSFAELREQAIALRRAGKSRREIKEILQIGSNQTLNEALRGEPPLMSTWRPNAKDDLRAKARELRQQGLVYNEIAAKLGVSKSSVSLWVRDMPRPERLSYQTCRQRQAAGVAAYWAVERQRREKARAAVTTAAANQIGQLTDREILIAGAIAYWCEGAKNKPHRRSDCIDFINSDPLMIKFFLRFLQAAGVSTDRLTFRVSIHETADVAAAERFWRQTIGLDGAQFNRALIKRHNPRTVRKNTGADYHGCLRIQVRRGTRLYRQIEGWASAVMVSPPPNVDAVANETAGG